MELIRSIYDAVVDKSPEELIGAVMVALAMSLTMTGLYALGRRKVSDTLPLVTGLMVVVCVVSMALAAGSALHARRAGFGIAGATAWSPKVGPFPPGFRPGGPPGPVPPWFRPGGFAFGWPPSQSFIKALDADRDGRVTPEEAARFVRSADASGRGSADAGEIAKVMSDLLRPPPGAGPPGSGKPRAREGPGTVHGPGPSSAQALGLEQADRVPSVDLRPDLVRQPE
jgi:hypothetical protein